MKKSRQIIRDLDEETYVKLITDIHAVFSVMEGIEFHMPSWASMMLYFVTENSLDVSFFSDQRDYFVWYSKVLIRRNDDTKVASFQRDEDGKWQLFLPPPIIGVNLHTKLR